MRLQIIFLTSPSLLIWSPRYPRPSCWPLTSIPLLIKLQMRNRRKMNEMKFWNKYGAMPLKLQILKPSCPIWKIRLRISTFKSGDAPYLLSCKLLNVKLINFPLLRISTTWKICFYSIYLLWSMINLRQMRSLICKELMEQLIFL